MATAEETAPQARVAQARVVATAEETAAVARVAEARVVATAEETAESVRVAEARVVATAEETARVAEARVVAKAEETVAEVSVPYKALTCAAAHEWPNHLQANENSCRHSKYRATYGRVKGAGKHATWTTRLQAKAEAQSGLQAECTRITAELGRVGCSRVLGKGIYVRNSAVRTRDWPGSTRLVGRHPEVSGPPSPFGWKGVNVNC